MHAAAACWATIDWYTAMGSRALRDDVAKRKVRNVKQMKQKL